MKRAITFAACLAAIGAMAGNAHAHSTALGTNNAGAPGTVTIWLGSYHTGAPNEGSMQITGGPSAVGSTLAFNQVSNSLPAGLVVGTNYFYADSSSTPGGFTSPTPTFSTSALPTRWQGVTFSGLAAGNYTYTIQGMNTVNWADWNTGQANWNGTFSLSQSVVQGTVPEPSSLALLGLGALGLIGYRVRKRKQTA